MPAESLLDLARRSCMKSFRGITDIGDIPYELLRPVLLKIENPEQLHTLEQNSPQIIGKDREIWISFLKRDIPDYDSKPHEPSDPKNWWKVYRKLKREAQQEIAEGDERLKAALNSAQLKKGPAAQMVTRDKLPTPGVRKRQAMTYDYHSGRTGSKGAHKLSLMDKIRKEARGASTKKMSRPTHELQKKQTSVVKAPQSFLRDIKQQNLAKVPLAEAREAMGYTTVRAPRPAPRPPGSGYDLTQDRKARLKSLKAGKQASRPTSNKETGDSGSDANHLTLDFLEDEEDDELFGVASNSRTSPTKDSGSPRPGLLSTQSTTPKRKDPPKLFMPQHGIKRKRPGIT